MRRIKVRQGFTLVELSLSLVFIGVLSLTIALIINNAVSSYRRGVTLNQVNTVGMELVDDIRGALQASPPDRDKICGDNKDCKRTELIYEENGLPMYGAVCTGKYSYVWNSGYAVSSGKKVSVEGDNDFRLAKWDDPITESNKETICSKNNESIDRFALPDKAKNKEEILLAEDDENPLVLYSFKVQKPAVGPKGDTAYYTASFILGTVQGGININATGDFCKAPKDGGGAFDYCAINKFNFAAQATGGKSVEKK